VRVVTLVATAVVSLLAAACSGSTTANKAIAGVDLSSDGPGVTDDTVKIGFTVLDTASLASALKLDFPDQGDQVAQVEALVEWVNANGGIGGRQVEAVTREFEALFDTAEAEETLCNEFAKDDEAFAVTMWGFFQENMRPCFAANEVIMLEGTLYPLPRQTMEDLAPYYMAPNFAVYEDVIAGLGGVFEETGYLDGGTVGVLGVDTEANRQIYEDELVPVLEEAGSPAAEVRWIDLKDTANTRAGYEQAIIAYKAAGVDRLVTLGGSRLLSYFLDFAKKQSFAPKLVLTSYDNIDFNSASYPDLMSTAVGLSASPSWDFTEEQLASPANDAEELCTDIYVEAGIDLGGRSSARTAQFTCDFLMFLRAAADRAGIEAGSPMNAGLIYQGAQELADEWEAGQNYLTRFADGVVAGSGGYQAFEFDPATGGPVLVGEPREFG
jgi:ABC-type branched-subunit amino acid transport system substrate-binding protein